MACGVIWYVCASGTNDAGNVFGIEVELAEAASLFDDGCGCAWVGGCGVVGEPGSASTGALAVGIVLDCEAFDDVPAAAESSRAAMTASSAQPW
eukprot:m.231633 g.231633  ORF g.231633 m.231633 type:complete len:94 (+) comp17368_c0_seq1:4109-4390(+)